MKKLGLIILSVLFAVGIYACEPTGDAATIDEMLDRLASNVLDEYSKGDYYLFSEITRDDTSYRVNWKSDNGAITVTSETRENEDGTKEVKIVVGEVTETVDVKLTATIQRRSKDFSVKVRPQAILSLNDFRSAANGAIVTFQGVVTYIYLSSSGQFDAYVQEAGNAGGAYIYRIPEELHDLFVVGNKVSVTGPKAVYYGQHEISNPTTASVISTNNQLESTLFTKGADINNADKQFALADITGVLKTNTTLTAPGTVTFASTDDNVEFDVRFNSDTWQAFQTEAVAGTKFTFTKALISSYSNVPQLAIYDNNQTVKGTLATAAELKALVTAHYAGVLPAEDNQVTLSISLPTTAHYGSVIEWSSSNPAVISNTGTVVRQATDTEVTLTYTVKSGTDVVAEASLDFTVLKTEGGDVEVLANSFDFSTLTNDTAYYPTETNFKARDAVTNTDKDFSRINANISQEVTATQTKGIVLAIREGSGGSVPKNNFATPRLTSKFAVTGLKAIEFSWENWRTDFSYNFAAFVDKVIVESSADGTNWVEEEDLTARVDVGTSAVNTFKVAIQSTGAQYFRISLVAKGNLPSSTYQLRAIFTSLKVYS